MAGVAIEGTRRAAGERRPASALRRRQVVRSAQAPEGLDASHDARGSPGPGRAGGNRQGARRTAQGRLSAAADGPARCAAHREQDRRARAHGQRAAARGEMPRVLRRGLRRADSPGAGRHHVRAQAGRRREVFEGHGPLRRSLSRDAGRIGPDRPHPRQVHRGYPDSEREPRADLAPGTPRVRSLPPVPVKAVHRARQDHPRRALHGRPRDDAASPHRGIDRRRANPSASTACSRASSIAPRRTMSG